MITFRKCQVQSEVLGKPSMSATKISYILEEHDFYITLETINFTEIKFH